MAKDYNIAKTTGRCTACNREMQPGEELVATIRQNEEEFARVDYCPACWQAAAGAGGNEGVFGVWRTRVPQPKEKRKLFVDDEVLVSFFERLAGAEEPAKVQFRFVLGLVLMRKKLLVYEQSRRAEDARDVWTMRFKGSQTTCEVTDPNMDEDKIAEVSRQIGEILEAEL